jgi:hypothetical protein
VKFQAFNIFGTVFGYEVLQIAEKQNFRTREGEEKC